LQTPDAVVEKLGSNKEKVYQYVQQQFLKKYNLQWLKPIGFNNTYALMMRKKQSEDLKINNISGLVNYLKTKK
jgi:osmoprotectant transport system permease protein